MIVFLRALMDWHEFPEIASRLWVVAVVGSSGKAPRIVHERDGEKQSLLLSPTVAFVTLCSFSNCAHPDDFIDAQTARIEATEQK